jgi:hypothetical protein
MHATRPVVQRVVPVAVEALEVALTATIVLHEEHAITLGRLTVVSGTASRRGDPPQPKDRDSGALIMHVSRTSPILPNVRASFYVHWQGNDFGEMGAAYVDVSPEHTAFTHSSLSAEFKPLDSSPNKGTGHTGLADAMDLQRKLRSDQCR